MKRATYFSGFGTFFGVMLAAAGGLAAEPNKSRLKMPTPPALGQVDAGGVYRLSAEEIKYDCKKLTGRMQVRIMMLQNGSGKPGSDLSRALQQGTKSLYGGTSHGSDPEALRRSDKALLEAYNGRLRELNCKSYDLAKALASPPAADPPQPTVAAPDPTKKPAKSKSALDKLKSWSSNVAPPKPAPAQPAVQGAGKNSDVRPDSR